MQRLRKRGRLLVGLAIFALLLTAGCAQRRGTAATAPWVAVNISDGFQHISVHTRTAQTVGDALKEAGFTVSAQDRVVPALETALRPGLQVEVRRAVPVTIQAGGRVLPLLTVAPTVAALLDELKLELGRLDRVVPAPDTAISPDLAIRLVRGREIKVVRQESIAFRTLRREDAGLPFGETKVVQAGQPGIMEVTLSLLYEDDELVRTAVVGERVVRPPVDQIIAFGHVGVVSRGGQTLRYKQELVMESTAYTPRDGGISGITATGTPARRGTIAVDPRVIPLGTRLYVEGYGFGVAEDTGGLIKGNIIDVCVDTVAEALQWGRRKVRVYVLAD